MRVLSLVLSARDDADDLTREMRARISSRPPVISMILGRARALFVCVMYTLDISRMEIARARRDALELYRSFGRFIDDGEYHIPVIRRCVSSIVQKKKK